jgi:hypothetical protein
VRAAEQLTIISKAWGQQDGYCFFPWIDGKAKNRKQRIQGYHEGPAFKWPEDKSKIIEHMENHHGDDLYWCPSLFEKKARRLEFAMDEHALWADLDEVDPREVPDEYRPTVAWETSPGRYQALWIISGGDVQGASWPGGENQRLTYYLGADVGGWDTTQLLRIPGWNNHKPDYRQGNGGNPVGGRLLWKSGRRFLPDDFEDLPEVASATGIAQDVIEAEIERVDRHEVWGRVRLKVSKRVRELIGAREAAGDRSDALWEIERELADAGCTVPEIVAVARETCWNKFSGRNDELKRLITEASKAWDQRSEEVVEQIEADLEPKPAPTRLTSLLANVKPPVWLVEHIWAEASCGFIAGQPKSYKSWTAFDLALSVATGMDFLGYFKVVNQGPVLMIQEEDPAPVLKSRFEKIWPGKLTDRMEVRDGQVVWVPRLEVPKDPDVMAYVGEGFTASDPGWQAWLDDTLAEGLDGQPYRMVLMDPLMMIAGDVDEHRAQEMTEKLFKPLKQLSRKHNIAIVMVHHMRKGDPKGEVRGGQKMLGSVANHAWTEDALYLMVKGKEILVEHESKHSPSGSFRIGRIRNREWVPVVSHFDSGMDEEDPAERAVVNPRDEKPAGRPRTSMPRAVELLATDSGGYTATQLAHLLDMSISGVSKQLRRGLEDDLVKKRGTLWYYAR